MKKTIEEIEHLKQNWLADPNWDIEKTEGFEEHVEELLAFRVEKELAWQQLAEDFIARRSRTVTTQTGVTNSSIKQHIATFKEIENDLGRVEGQRTAIDSDAIAIANVRATLLLAAQISRIADALESMDSDAGLLATAKIWGAS